MSATVRSLQKSMSGQLTDGRKLLEIRRVYSLWALFRYLPEREYHYLRFVKRRRTLVGWDKSNRVVGINYRLAKNVVLPECYFMEQKKVIYLILIDGLLFFRPFDVFGAFE